MPRLEAFTGVLSRCALDPHRPWHAALLLAFACQARSAPDPRIETITPSYGIEGRAAPVLIEGAGFVAAVEADVGNTSPPRLHTDVKVLIGNLELPVGSALRVDAERIRATIPGTIQAGTHDVSVQTAAGKWTTRAAAFTVFPASPSSSAGASGLGGAAASGGTSQAGGRSDQVAGAAGDAGHGGASGSLEAGGASDLPNGGSGASMDAGAGPGGSSGATGGRTSTSYSCTQPVDAATISLYLFENDLSDAAGNHPANYTGSTAPRYVEAPPNCGVALALESRYYVFIGDHPDWNLTSGSIDFWYLPGPISDDAPGGILSRDAAGSARPGHVTVYQAGGGSGRIVVRMQDGSDLYVCSDEPVRPGVWMHVGLNFGPPAVELYIDGALQSYTGSVPFYADTVECELIGTHGIAGNSNFWVLGASADISGEGNMNDLRGFLEDAAINALRFSRQRRDFTR